MATEKDLLLRYLSDVSSIWNSEFIVEAESYFTQNGKDERKITPRDINQITLNFNLKNDENLVEFLRSNGCDLIYEDQVYRIIKDSFDKEYGSPEIRLKQLNVIEGMDIAYNMMMQERISEHNIPQNIIALSYELKNALKFPDEFFNEFPTIPISTPTKNSQSSLVNYGRVQGMRVYYVYYYMNGDVILPSSAYPARIKLDASITFKGLFDAIAMAFDTFSGTEDFQEYLDYRMLKNIRNKYVAKKGKPVSLSLLTKNEIEFAEKTGLFKATENTLMLVDGKNMEDVNTKIDEMRIETLPVIRKWKNTPLFP